MKQNEPRRVILLAEDDPDDRFLAREAMEACKMAGHAHFVEDGEELMDYLRRRGQYIDPRASPRPNLILLDLNMLRKNGRESLREIKSDESLNAIPVVIMTTSQTADDVQLAYNDGANSYISKPVTFEGLVDIMAALKQYWFEVVSVPHEFLF